MSSSIDTNHRPGDKIMETKYTRTNTYFDGTPVSSSDEVYTVYFDGQYTGFMVKMLKGYAVYLPHGVFVAYRIGARKKAAEALARTVGLLD